MNTMLRIHEKQACRCLGLECALYILQESLEVLYNLIKIRNKQLWLWDRSPRDRELTVSPVLSLRTECSFENISKRPSRQTKRNTQERKVLGSAAILTTKILIVRTTYFWYDDHPMQQGPLQKYVDIHVHLLLTWQRVRSGLATVQS